MFKWIMGPVVFSLAHIEKVFHAKISGVVITLILRFRIVPIFEFIEEGNYGGISQQWYQSYQGSRILGAGFIKKFLSMLCGCNIV